MFSMKRKEPTCWVDRGGLPHFHGVGGWGWGGVDDKVLLGWGGMVLRCYNPRICSFLFIEPNIQPGYISNSLKVIWKGLYIYTYPYIYIIRAPISGVMGMYIFLL